MFSDHYPTTIAAIKALLIPPVSTSLALNTVRSALAQHPRSSITCRVGPRTLGSNWAKSIQRWLETGTFTWASSAVRPNTRAALVTMRDEIARTGHAIVLLRFSKSVMLDPETRRTRPVRAHEGVVGSGYFGMLVVNRCYTLPDADADIPSWVGQWTDGFEGQVLVPLNWWNDPIGWPITPVEGLAHHVPTQDVKCKSSYEVRRRALERLTEMFNALSTAVSVVNTNMLEIEWANRRSEDPITERKFREPPSRVHNNQLAAADEVVDLFLNKQVHIVLLTALEQSGKGGVIQALTYLMIKHWLSQGHADGGTQINTTGMSMLDWMRTQRRDTFRQCRAWVQHRPTRSLLKGRPPKRVLITIDEGHIGTGNELVLHRQLLQDKLFGSPEYLRSQEIYILIVTATPSATLADLVRVGHNNAQVVCMQPGVGYSGFQQLLQSSRLMEAGDLRLRRVAKKYISTLVSRWSSAPMYHIVRVTSDLAIKNVRRYVPSGWQLIACDSTPDAIAPGIDTHRRNLLRLLNIAPTVPSIVFIKDFARCAVRLNLKYVGSMYEPVLRTVDATAHRQGLPGRSCNYYGFVHVLVFASRAVLEEAVREFATGLPGNSKDARVRYRAGNVVVHTPSMFGALASSTNRKRKLPTSAQDAPYPLVKRHQAQLMMPREADELDWLDGETVQELRTLWRQNMRPPTGVVLNTEVQDLSCHKMVPAQVYQTGENEFKAAYLPEWLADEEWVG